MLRLLLWKTPLFASATLAMFIGGCVPTVVTDPPATIPEVADPVEAAPVTTQLPADPADGEPFAVEEGYVLLTRDDFDAFGADPDTWSATDEGVRCTGKPRGYLYTKQPYGNFTLRLQYRFDRPMKLPDEAKFKGNTGFLMYITGTQIVAAQHGGSGEARADSCHQGEWRRRARRGPG